MNGLVVACLLTVMINLGILGIVIKLYSEIFKVNKLANGGILHAEPK